MKKFLLVAGIMVVIIFLASIFINASKKDSSNFLLPSKDTNPVQENIIKEKNTTVVVVKGTRAGINEKIQANGASITPLKVIEDSRCASDVACIWMGIIRISINLEVDSKAVETQIGLGETITYGNKRITFESASPEPNSKTQIPLANYVFSFDIKNGIVEPGFLKGHMTISPICPVENINNPCLPTKEMYASKKIYVYKSNKKTLVATIIPDAKGDFSQSLPDGIYYVDMEHQKVGGISGVPVEITIPGRGVYTLNIDVDTGIR